LKPHRDRREFAGLAKDRRQGTAARHENFMLSDELGFATSPIGPHHVTA
jgi:hypothetical protein